MSDAPNPRKKRSLIAYVIVLVSLFGAGLTLNAAVLRLRLTFQKLPVDPAQPLKMVHADLGPWAQVSVDRALNPDFEHELGATQYLFRDYIDTRLLSEKDRKALLAASIEDREKMRATLGPIDPKGMIRFALTYYTGSVDTVPHVPDRCYAADGFNPDSWQVVQWPVLPRKNPKDRLVKVRLINFVDQIDSRHARPRQVSYFFQVNGDYEEDPIFGVRQRLQNLFERKAYFAKIELVTDLPTTDAAQQVMTDFLTNAMPDIERVLPDWSKVVQ
ncbi:MAG: exosortase-associated EpsI family protein [Tepidisphaeraceae bacterium]